MQIRDRKSFKKKKRERKTPTEQKKPPTIGTCRWMFRDWTIQESLKQTGGLGGFGGGGGCCFVLFLKGGGGGGEQPFRQGES